MPKKRKKDTDTNKSWGWRRTGAKHDRQRRNRTRDEDDPALLAKRKEIEDALEQQRQRRAMAAPVAEPQLMDIEEGDTPVNEAAAAPALRLPGYYYDDGKGRYFKVDRSRMSAATHVGQKRNPSKARGLTMGSGATENSLISVLSSRLLGHRVGPAGIMNQLLGRTGIRRLNVGGVSPSDAMSVHPVFGLAVSKGAREIKFESHVLPPLLDLQSRHTSQVLAVAWNPNMVSPIIACLKHTERVDRVDIYRIDAENGYDAGEPQSIVGVLPSKHQKEIFQSIAWAVDGQACYTGGDVGLWRHDLEGRRGRRLVLDGISIVNAIQPHSNGCIVMGLRNGNVVRVDERERDRKGISVATLMRAIDHVHTLRDGHSLICQDVTNNILLYDARVPRLAVHTIRGSGSSPAPRAFSYYEGEALVRNRKFWISPRYEYLVVSDGTRGDEALVVVDPRAPLQSDRRGTDVRGNVLHTLSMNSHDSIGNSCSAHRISGHWKLAVNGCWPDDMLLNSSMSEFEGCFGMGVQAASASAADGSGFSAAGMAPNNAWCMRLANHEDTYEC